MDAEQASLATDTGLTDTGEMIRLARRAALQYRASFEGTEPDSVRLPEAAVDELAQSLACTARQEVRQIVLFASSRRPASLARGVWQQAAAQCSFLRYYVVPSGADAARAVDREIAEDRRYGLASVAIPVHSLTDLTEQPISDAWLIDNQVAVRQEQAAEGPATWLVSRQTPEVNRVNSLVRLVDRYQRATSAGSRTALVGPQLTDRLLRSARLLYNVAPMSCTDGFVGDNCVWYHRVWQYLRLFDMVSSPTWHAPFYQQALRKALSAQDRPRVLITGAADYTTLAFVLDAAHELGREVEVHVLDKCQTPLLACRWYADQCTAAGQTGALVRTHQVDLTNKWALRREPDLRDFDVIVADAFLTRFPPERAVQVLHSWRDLLRPGGQVVTTIRLHPQDQWRSPEAVSTVDSGAEDADGYLPADPVDVFERRLRQRAGAWRRLLPVEIKDLAGAARTYARSMTSHNLGGSEEITGTFRRAGFTVQISDSHHVAGELRPTNYLQVLAGREPGRWRRLSRLGRRWRGAATIRVSA